LDKNNESYKIYNHRNKNNQKNLKYEGNLCKNYKKKDKKFKFYVPNQQIQEDMFTKILSLNIGDKKK